MPKKWDIFRSTYFVLVFLILFSFYTLAHGDEPEEESTERSDTEMFYTKISLLLISAAALVIGVVTYVSLRYEKKIKKHSQKRILFLAITIPTVIATLFLAGSTIYVNVISETKGPVHWHADYEVWACDEKLDLTNPEGLSNRIGTSTFHEHGDDRMHVEGVVVNYDDVTLKAYFDVINGELTDTKIVYPTINGVKTFKNGDKCPDGSVGNLNVYVNSKKIDHHEHYILSPYSNVPPGDCIIFDFSSKDEETTEKICSSWTARGWNYDNMVTKIIESGEIENEDEHEEIDNGS